MAGWNGAGSGTKAGAIGVAAVVLVGGVYALWPAPPPLPPAPVAKTEVGLEAANVAEVAPDVASEPEVAVADTPEVAMAVVVDTWRVAPDGAGIVVGLAPPGAVMWIMVDGAVVAEAPVSALGEFAVPLGLAPNPKPSLMMVQAVAPDGAVMAEPVVIALGPIVGPVVAVADPPEVAPAAEGLAEPAPVTALLVTDAGAVVVQDAPVAAGAGVSIDAISYTATGAVSLAGQASAGAVLQIYLDNAPIQSMTVPKGGKWLTTLQDTAPGIYTLRVDQLDAAGKVTSRFETPFQRETLEALAGVAAADVAALAVPDADTVPDADAVPVVEAVVEPEAVAEAVVEDVPAVAPDAIPETVPEAAPESVVEANPTPEAVPVTEPVPEPVAEPEVVAIAEVAPEPVAEPAPAPAPPPAKVSAPAAISLPSPVTVTVQPGFTLWGIAKGQMGEGVMYVQVFEANKDKIRDPDLIYPGQVLILPQAE